MNTLQTRLNNKDGVDYDLQTKLTLHHTDAHALVDAYVHLGHPTLIKYENYTNVRIVDETCATIATRYTATYFGVGTLSPTDVTDVTIHLSIPFHLHQVPTTEIQIRMTTAPTVNEHQDADGTHEECLQPGNTIYQKRDHISLNEDDYVYIPG